MNISFKHWQCVLLNVFSSNALCPIPQSHEACSGFGCQFTFWESINHGSYLVLWTVWLLFCFRDGRGSHTHQIGWSRILIWTIIRTFLCFTCAIKYYVLLLLVDYLDHTSNIAKTGRMARSEPHWLHAWTSRVGHHICVNGACWEDRETAGTTPGGAMSYDASWDGRAMTPVQPYCDWSLVTSDVVGR